MRLPRPYIPLRVRVQVAERQVREKLAGDQMHGVLVRNWPLSARLHDLLHYLFGDQKVELHHRPALCNRRKVAILHHGTMRGPPVTHDYDPPANDPDYLVYLPRDEHDIETRVRGQHGDYSDLAKARKRKRKARKAKRKKYRWPKRKLQSRPFRKS